MYKRIPPHHLERIGEVFNNITILDFFLENGQLKVKYKCSCGNEGTCRTIPLHKKCMKCHYKNANQWAVTHKLSKSPEYTSWQAMRKRCSNPNDPAYHNYGGRGIKVCRRWEGDGGFERFLNDMGKRPEPRLDYSLDRIDNSKGYMPDNCKWSNRHDQIMNKRKGDGVYRIHDKICSVCSNKFKGYFKNLYCSRSCQQEAYRKRLAQGMVNRKSSGKTSEAGT